MYTKSAYMRVRCLQAMMSHINGNGLFIMEKDAGQISLT